MESTSTKIRPVFDGSARTSNGKCANDLFLTGPSQYPLIAVILLQFRSYPIAVTADISKMYREVKLQEQDKNYHRFFLRNEDGKICEARMARLIFGMRPSPFVATAVIRHHAELNKQEFPDASKAILSSFYVDDFIGGAATVEEALHLQQSLCKLLSMAEMNLRKWRSSHTEVIVDDFIGGAATVEEALHLQQSLCKLLSMAGMNLRKWRSSHTEVLNQIPEEIQEKEDRKLMMKRRIPQDSGNSLGCRTGCFICHNSTANHFKEW